MSDPNPKISHVTAKTLEKCRKLARRKGFADLADDFAQDVAAGKLGKKQRIEYAFIDFLRRTFGSEARSPNIYSIRKAERQAFRELDNLGGISFSDLPENMEFNDILGIIDNRIDRAIIALYFVWGLSCREIGLCFRLAEANVGIRLKRTKEFLKTAYFESED